MRTSTWRKPALVIVAALSTGLLSPWAFAQEVKRPADETPGLVRNFDPDADNDGQDATKKEEFDQDDPNARLDWERGSFGVTTPAYRTLAMKQGKNHADKKNARGPKWINIGPFGADYEQNGGFTGHVRDSGRARAILPHPTNSDIVYVLTSGGGLWRTNNWTSPNTEWTPLTDDLPTTGGGSAAFGKNPNTIYLGLGDPYDQILVGGSMTKTKDGGGNWSPVIELGNAVSVRDVKVDTTTNKDIVLVATDSGLYRSADEGATYTAVPAFAGTSVWSIARTSAGWLVSAQPCAAGGLQCGTRTTLYLSTDKGATWAPISNAGGVFADAGRTTLAVGAPGDNVVYAYASQFFGPLLPIPAAPASPTLRADSSLRDIYRSTDGGQTWVSTGTNISKAPTNAVPGVVTEMNVCHVQCWYDQMIVVDPRDTARNTLWIGGDLGTAQSTNGGSSWAFKTWWLYNQVPQFKYAHADNHTAAFKMTGTPTLILGNDGGFNITEDNGGTFSSDKNNGLATHLYYTITGNANYPNFVMGGLQDNGTRARFDNTGTFSQILGGDGAGSAYSIDNTNTLIGSSQGSSMRVNLSNAPTTAFYQSIAATAGLSDVGFPFLTAIVPAPAGLDPTGRVFFHFSLCRVWKTTNGGQTWGLIASSIAPPVANLVPTPGLAPNRQFRSSNANLSLSPTDATFHHIAVGAAGGFLDVTADGATWADIDLLASVPGYQGFVTSVTWQDNKTLWITSVAQSAGAVRVIKATVANDTTAAWKTATYEVKQTGLPDLPVTRVVFDPRDASRNTLFAATHVGVYRTTDGGNSWAPFGIGLPNVRVNDIYMPPDGGTIRLATYGRGIWELSQLELVSTSLNDDGAKCDRDGILDNGENGRLVFTLLNQGPNTVNHVTMTVTSDNPHITFPDGNVASFPPMQKNDVTTGSIRVALKGASGIENVKFTAAFQSSELQLPTPLTLQSYQRVNYDAVPRSSTTETVEFTNSGWTTGGIVVAPNNFGWQRRQLSPTQTIWFGPDNNGTFDDVHSGPDTQTLTSPVMHVSDSDPLVVTFTHRYSFENGGWDGGLLEITTDGGSHWTDVSTTAYNGTARTDTASPNLAGRRAFINKSAGWPNFVTSTFNGGTAFAGKEVQIRFRVASDEATGAPGWDIDNISVSGLSDKPFTGAQAQTAVCSTSTLAASN